ncbi:MAG TPA: ribosome biogenesis GTPase Der [Prolixibacteraceae bacterium]|jgi:GTP-binding protein|nr:ribosome biogenesis GTPase Der [Bacteroidales bacterium]OQB81724.1 MAG: GTPase Der [Bacteroidetes bacterium ADurb.Bin123]HNZ67732.1 ribosome biogenesis GTPase Der [Prolixibacteraceae bacterium]HOC85444.1 ribosome biogenesis GTPase Der [Prolixibacteraceae bacterium]HOF54126.1 ribosome biogenesis GTPase Der [Prolixibacteraceae bacterium]
MSRIAAIVGRPNVGKSTLFNRLVESRKAIVDDVSGVTRDRIYGKCQWNGVEFSVIDTGGYVIHSDDVFEEQIRKQVLLAIEEADVILFVVDVELGITDLDEGMAAILRKSGKHVLPVVNKVDNNNRLADAQEFYSLGLGEIFCISSMTGSGTGELLDEVVKAFPSSAAEEEEVTLPRFTVVGRPNVGKSSFINALIGEERNIVTDIAGTTRDAIHTRYNKFGHDFIIIDTAGLRKRAKVKEDLEFYSVLRSVRTIEEADVCLLMLDAERGIEAQDLSIFSLIQKNRKGVLFLVNKWDLVEKDSNSVKKFRAEIDERIAPFTDVPVVFISALTKQRIHKALETAMRVYENQHRKIKTSELNEVMLAAIEAYPPPSWKGKFIKIKYCTQLPSRAPGFVFFANLPQYIREPYRRYLENKLRENFDFSGVPLQIFFRQK